MKREIKDNPNRAYVYQHRRRDISEIFYVGIGWSKEGAQNEKTRFARAYAKAKRNKFWERIVAKTEYDVEIIESDLTYEEAAEKECYWIDHYGRRDLYPDTGTLTNMTNGADGSTGLVVSEETRLKIGVASKGRCAKFFAVVTPDNKLVTGFNMEDYAKEVGLFPQCINDLWLGKRMKSHGFSTPFPRIFTVEYKIISPDNQLFIFDKIGSFSKEYNINTAKLSSVLKGEITHIKGWHLPNPSLSVLEEVNNYKQKLQNIKEKKIQKEINRHKRELQKQQRVPKPVEKKGKQLKTFVLITPDEQIIFISNIAKFAKYHGLDDHDLRRLSNGKKKEYMGYKSPYPTILPPPNMQMFYPGKFFALISPNNELVTGDNLREFCRERNLNRAAISDLVHGRINVSQGYLPASPNFYAPPKENVLLSPNGEFHRFTNISEFSRDHKICRKAIFKLCNKIIAHYKGWTLARED